MATLAQVFNRGAIRRGADKTAEVAVATGGFYRVYYTGSSGDSNSRLAYDPEQTAIDGTPQWEFTVDEDGEIVLPVGVYMGLLRCSLNGFPESTTYVVLEGDGNTGGGDGRFSSEVADLTITKLFQQDEPGQIYVQLRSADDPPLGVSTCQVTLVRLG